MKRVGLIVVSIALLVSLFAQSGHSARKNKDLDRLNEIETLASQGRTDEAISAYQSFVKDYPKSDNLGAAYLALGKLYITKKDYDQALKAFSQAMAASKQSSEKEEASLLTGKIYFTQKKYQDANDSLQGVFKNAHDQKMKTEMANVLFQSNRQLGKYQQAVFWLGQYSLAAEPKDAERARAVLPDLIPKLSDAEIGQARKAEGPDWLKGELTFTLGKRYFEEGKTDESKEMMETLLKKYRDSPKREEAGNLLGLIDKMSKVESGRIGLILPLSGPYQSFGERALKGATLAAKIFGNSETASKIELRVVNADSDPQAAIDAVKKMVAEDNIIALVGPITNLNASAVADLAQEMGLPMIALSPSPELAKKGNFIFRDCLTKQVQVNALLDWAMNVKKLKKFAVIYPEDKYGNEFADLFDKQVQERGGSLIKKVAYSEGETDFRDQVQSLMRGRAWDFDALFIPDSWEAVDLIVPQVLYFKIDTQLLGPSGWHSAKLFDQIRSNYVEGAAVVDLFSPELKSEAFEKYQYNYQQAFQENPSLVDAQAYEAVSLLIDLLSNKNVTSRKTLADALSKTDSWTGPLGTIKVNPDGEVTHQLTLFKIHKGEFEPVK